MNNPYPPSPRLDVLAHVPRGVRTLLDVGCNTGAFGQELKRQRPGMLVWGVEPSTEAAKAASVVLDNVLTGLYPNAMEAEDKRFDCIVFNDVLEHMADPEVALRAVSGSLVPGGVVLASVPNVRYIRIVLDLVLRGRWTYTETGILDRTHLRFFTRNSLRALFEDEGFVVDKIVPLSVFGERFGVKRPQALLMREFSHGQFLVVAYPRQSREA